MKTDSPTKADVLADENYSPTKADVLADENRVAAFSFSHFAFSALSRHSFSGNIQI
jgi:hypothetical protein